MLIYTDSQGRTVQSVHTRSQAQPDGTFANCFVIKHGQGSTGLHFQTGAPSEFGVNGVTSQCLLAALIHRTHVMNEQLPCAENEVALMALREALEAFEQRTAKRAVQRAIELDRV